VAIHAMHPGEHLAEELEELGMSAAELARELDVPANRVTETLNERRAMTGDTSLRLAHSYGTTAEFCSKAAPARLFSCFRRSSVKESGAPRPAHGRRRQPCAPTQVPRSDQRLPASKNRLCAPWSPCTARR